MDLEERLRAAVTRVYQAAGLRLGERDVYSLARVYADWAAGCDGHGTGRPVAPISLDEIYENLRIATARVPGILRRAIEPG